MHHRGRGAGVTIAWALAAAARRIAVAGSLPARAPPGPLPRLGLLRSRGQGHRTEVRAEVEYHATRVPPHPEAIGNGARPVAVEPPDREQTFGHTGERSDRASRRLRWECAKQPRAEHRRYFHLCSLDVGQSEAIGQRQAQETIAGGLPVKEDLNVVLLGKAAAVAPSGGSQTHGLRLPDTRQQSQRRKPFGRLRGR